MDLSLIILFPPLSVLKTLYTYICHQEKKYVLLSGDKFGLVFKNIEIVGRPGGSVG